MNQLNVFLYGGLGNQMFQYAYGRKLSLEFNLRLNLNLNGFEVDKFYNREFDLQNFQIHFNEISSGSGFLFNVCRLFQHYPKQYKLIRNLFPRLIIQNEDSLNSNLLKIDKMKEFYLYGY